MKDEKLSAACEKIFLRVDLISKKRESNEHDSYLKLWETLRQEDRKIVEMFDDLTRSRAIVKLVFWRRYGMLTDDELLKFTDETQTIIQSLTNGRC